jgi:hypothetical protein
MERPKCSTLGSVDGKCGRVGILIAEGPPLPRWRKERFVVVEIKILSYLFMLNKAKVERELEKLVNDGWRIVTACGSGSTPAFVIILEREAGGYRPDSR